MADYKTCAVGKHAIGPVVIGTQRRIYLPAGGNGQLSARIIQELLRNGYKVTAGTLALKELDDCECTHVMDTLPPRLKF